MNLHVKSPEFKLIAIAENERNGQFYAVIEYRNVRGELRQIRILRSILKNRKVLREALENAGAYFSLLADENDAALAVLLTQERKAAQWKYVSSVGWHANSQVFVLPNAVIGEATSGVI